VELPNFSPNIVLRLNKKWKGTGEFNKNESYPKNLNVKKLYINISE